MKKKALQFAIGLLIISNGAFAQWSTPTPGVSYTTDKVGIGTSSSTDQISFGSDGEHLTMGLASYTNKTILATGWINNIGDFTDIKVPGNVPNNTALLRLLFNSNLGIGTTNITNKVTVLSDQQNDGILLGGSDSKSVSLFRNTTYNAFNSLTQQGDNIIFWRGTTHDDPNAGGLVLAPWSSGSKGMRITPDGNVGIGTANPGSFKLAVEGNIGAREIQVTLTNPFPDYVFAPSYKLRSLASLEQYINQNKHLPGIPSAGEVEKKGGVELGQLNTKLLEKVEELTLYVIELKKENEQMKKEIEKLSKRK